MITVIPALDIIDGKCVRLEMGDYMRQTRYENDPLSWAKLYEDTGFKRLHLVDLDGARTGEVQNLKVLEAIASSTGLRVDFGGGIKSTAALQQVFNAGAAMVTIGSVAVRAEHLLIEWIARFGPSRFILGADVKDKRIMISGWQDQTAKDIFDFIEYWLSQGLYQVLCTDINKDGMLLGSSVGLYRDILSRFPDISLIASGGISGIAEIQELNELGVKGVVLGKALLEGKILLNDLRSFIQKPSGE